MSDNGHTETVSRQTVLSELLQSAKAHFRRLERPDLEHRMDVARGRLDRHDTVLAVVGEFKQGKSSLINAIIGGPHSPVDDDLATATIAWFHHRLEPQIRAHSRDGGERVALEISADELDTYLSEKGNPANQRKIELVEVGLPSSVLARGITLIDTPGTDGINSATGRTVLAYVASAHGLILATDASSELNAVELRFLAEASARCPKVLVALTKTDLYPEWRRIRDLNVQHLGNVGLSAMEVVPVSSVLRNEALHRHNNELNDESGIPALMACIRSGVVDSVANQSHRRGVSDLTEAASDALAALQAQHTAISYPDTARQLHNDLTDARNRLEQLKRAGTRWSTVLSDGITDLNAATDEGIRVGFRELLNQADAELSALDPAAVWEGYTRQVRDQVATVARTATDQLIDGVEILAERVTNQLGEEASFHGARSAGFNLERLVDDAPDLGESKANPMQAVISGLRGGSSGIILLGMIGRLAGLALAAPVSIGVGVLFGAKQVLDERKRLLERRQQEARTTIRRYLSQSQTDLTTGLRELIREAQRSIRDAVSDRIIELNETCVAQIRSIEMGLRQDDAERKGTLPRLEAEITALEALVRQAGRLMS